jgi:mono/diheme cytochrome c family protein
MQPAKAGKCRGLDLTVAGRENDFGVTFQAFWKAETAGRYRFYLGSDDGSKLWVDNKEVVDADGVHPHSESSKSVRLEAGVHHIRVDYFQGGGEWSLALDVEAANEPRQPMESLLYFSRAEAENPPPKPRPEGLQAFDNDPALRAEGKELFQSRGCAACHQLKVDGNALASTRTARPLAELEPGRGCLASSSPKTSTATPAAPDFGLTSSQQAALTAALGAIRAGNIAESGDLIAATMSSFNCYACHKRGDVGSPERDRDALFITTILEMGDEGRIPPPLNGVGDKLNPDWLKHVLAEGAKDRPYMKTKMPRFGSLPVDELTKAFAEADQHETAPEIPALGEPAYRTKATGRKLAGNNGLACVKCHVFGNLPATGIQSIDLRKLTRRVREDWFDRYLVNPQKYRPGTRMPTSFVNGTSAVATIYDGHPNEQMKALWMYLSDGDQAGIPEGVQGETIELTPTDSPILYRNFLSGLSQRGIAVGYPEKAHLAWDAEKMCLALVWHGRFIDAGMHWNGRGQGAQSPLGDHVMRIDETTPIAKLASGDSEWPKTLPREHGYAFRGYTLNAKQQPSFLYDLVEVPAEGTAAEPHPKALVHIADFPEPAPDLATSSDPGFRRTITLTVDEAVDGLNFRAATGSKIEALPEAAGTYAIDGERKIRIRTTPTTQPVIRESNGKKELVVPLAFEDGRCEIVEEIIW